MFKRLVYRFMRQSCFDCALNPGDCWEYKIMDPADAYDEFHKNEGLVVMQALIEGKWLTQFIKEWRM